ncbi:hypothetical protein ACOMHN_029685 [Nucella lapillus]
MLTPRSKTLGLLLTLMFWGGLLLQCGDIEQNPGPRRYSVKNSKLSTGRRGSGDLVSGSDSGQTTPAPYEEPTMSEVMAMLHSIDSRCDRLEKAMKDPDQQVNSLQSTVADLREEVNKLCKEHQDSVGMCNTLRWPQLKHFSCLL